MKSKLIPIIIASAGLLLLAGSFLFNFSADSGDLDIEIQKASFIMPSAHKVYANPEAFNGKYHLFKAKLTNNTGKTLEDVTVRYQIPGYIEWTELKVSGEMFPGQTLVVPCYPKFNDDITKKTTSSIEKAQIEISWDGASEDDIVEEEFSFKITDRNDFIYTGIPQSEILGWADGYDNVDLLACFVTPNDPVVKYYTQSVQEKVLKGEATVFSNDPKDVLRFLTGIYDATLMTHMVYSGAKGIPQSLGDIASYSQQMRLPREVITGNTGLCIELSFLYASMISAAGLEPVIFLVPGHAYPGIKFKGQYYAIEATGIGGEGMGKISSSEEALQIAYKNLQEFFQKAQEGDPRYSIVDIDALKGQGLESMNMGDDDFLKGKVDKLAINFSPTEQSQAIVQYVNAPNTPDNNINVTPNNNNRNTGSNNLSFTKPDGWQVQNHPYAEVPILTAQVISPDQVVNVSVYDIPANSMEEGMQIMNQYFSNYGMNIQYQIKGNAITGITSSTEGNFNWIGKGLKTNSGIRLVAVGAKENAFSQKSNEINAIFNSIR